MLVIASDGLLPFHPVRAPPPLAVGLGIYLPTQSTLMVTVGAVAGLLRPPREPRSQTGGGQTARRAASLGMFGEGLVGVLLAAFVVFPARITRWRWSATSLPSMPQVGSVAAPSC